MSILLSFWGRGGVEISEVCTRGRFGRVVTAGVGVACREGREGSQGSSLTSSLTSCLTKLSFITPFLVISVGVSGDAAGPGLAGGAFGSQQIQRRYCFRPSVTFL